MQSSLQMTTVVRQDTQNKTYLDLGREDSATTHHCRCRVQKGRHVGNGSHNQSDQHQDAADLVPSECVKESSTSGQRIEGEAFGPVSHAKGITAKETQMGKVGPEEPAKDENADEVLFGESCFALIPGQEPIVQEDGELGQSQDAGSGQPDENTMSETVIAVVGSYRLEECNDKEGDPHEPSKRVEESSNLHIADRIFIVFGEGFDERGDQACDTETNGQDHPLDMNMFHFEATSNPFSKFRYCQKRVSNCTNPPHVTSNELGCFFVFSNVDFVIDQKGKEHEGNGNETKSIGTKRTVPFLQDLVGVHDDTGQVQQCKDAKVDSGGEGRDMVPRILYHNQAKAGLKSFAPFTGNFKGHGKSADRQGHTKVRHLHVLDQVKIVLGPFIRLFLVLETHGAGRIRIDPDGGWRTRVQVLVVPGFDRLLTCGSMNPVCRFGKETKINTKTVEDTS